MNDWMEGYTSDIEYTSGYYEELSPEFLNMCAVSAKIEPVDTENAFSYCELGCGQGLSILINASLYPHGTFYAVDYNPSHIAHARAIAKKANLTNIHFFENSFQELIDNSSLLSDVDFMVFHGIYTWVNDENRANLVELCRRHVVSGGVVYNSYNAKPGWLSGEPIQQLVWRLAKEYNGTSLEKIEQIIQTLDKLKDMDSGYFKNYEKDIKGRLEKMKSSDKHYIVHEYLHEKWKAFYFPEVCEEMEKAKLNFLCSAKIADSFMSELSPEKLKKGLIGIKDMHNKELIKDLALNTGFRKDIYVRGVRKNLSNYERIFWFINKEWMLLKQGVPKEFKFNLSVGEVKGDEKVYRPIIEQLNKGISSTQELHQVTKIKYSELIQALVILYDHKAIALHDKKQQNRADALNRTIVENLFNSGNFKYIILPHIKKSVVVNTIDMVWLNGIYAGFTTHEQLVQHAYNLFSSRGVAITHNKQQLTGESMLSRFKELEKEWREKLLPIWLEAGVVPQKELKKRKR